MGTVSTLTNTHARKIGLSMSYKSRSSETFIDNKARSPTDQHGSLETRLTLAFLPQCPVVAGVGMGGVSFYPVRALTFIVQVATALSATDSLSFSKQKKAEEK